MSLHLRGFLNLLRERCPQEIVTVGRPVSPAEFEVTALLKHLENRGRFPAVLFEKPLNLKGEVSPLTLASNLFATRERCAVALGLSPQESRLEVALEFARRENNPIPPQVIPKREAPVKEVIRVGEEADLRDYPIVRHHEMDPAPYVDMTPVLRDPDEGFYNLAFLRNMYKGPRKLGIHMSPRHSWQIYRKYEAKGKGAPVAIVVGHHPAFYLGALNVAAFGRDDYPLVGGILGEPLRLTASETWGEEFLVPADAEMIIEGEILPKVREVEAPFGEFTGYYGPQRLRPVIEVKAITHRRAGIFQHVFVGRRDNWVLGGIPKEGSIYNAVKGIVPTVKAVHFPLSGSCRFHCYISIDKRVDGESKQAALMAFATCDFVKNVVVVDGDIDVFNEGEVMFAVATRTQAHEDVDIIKNVKGNTLDPSQVDDIMTSKLLIDATKPARKPFSERVRVPARALEKIRLEDYLPAEVVERLPQHLDSIRSV